MTRLSQSTNIGVAQKAQNVLRLIGEYTGSIDHLPINPALSTAKQAYTGKAEEPLADEAYFEVTYYMDNQDLVFVQSETGGTYRIVNTLGQPVAEGKLNQVVTVVNMGHLTTGIYHVYFENSTTNQ
ncbi:MAG: hypothetical protein ACPGTG_03955, partial [Flavobacteriales bacterium]